MAFVEPMSPCTHAPMSPTATSRGAFLRCEAAHSGILALVNPPTSRYLDLSAGRFHLLDWGEPGRSAPPLLLLHGFNQTAHSWDEFAGRVYQQWRVIAVDQRGHGATAWARDGDYSRGAMVADIVQIMDRLQIARAPVVGMSMGAVHTAVLASEHPDRVAAVVLVDYAPQLEAVGLDKIKMAALASWASFDDAVAAMHRFNPRRSLDNLRERLRHSLRQRDDGRWTWAMDIAGFVDQPRFAEDPDIMWRTLGAIPCPVLLIRGGKSDVLGEDAAARVRDTLARGTLHTVPDAGHSVPGDNPDGFHDAVASFLIQHRP